MRKDISALIVRLIIGGIFIAAGIMKLSAMGGDMGTIAFFAKIGLPAFVAYLVAYVELIGGAFVVLGLWTCISAIPLAVIMLVAISLTYKMGIQGFGYPLVTLAGLVSLIGSCGGKYSLSLCGPCGKGGMCKTCSVDKKEEAPKM